jgi:hypothetical protein
MQVKDLVAMLLKQDQEDVVLCRSYSGTFSMPSVWVRHSPRKGAVLVEGDWGNDIELEETNGDK